MLGVRDDSAVFGLFQSDLHLLLVDRCLDNQIPGGITWLEWHLSPRGPLKRCQDLY